MKKHNTILYILIIYMAIIFSSSLFYLSETNVAKADFEIEKVAVFENFLRDDNDLLTVINNQNNITIGEKPYLSIPYGEHKEEVNANKSYLYYQYLNTEKLDFNEEGDKVLVIRMKSSSLKLNNIQLSIGMNESSKQLVYHNSSPKSLSKLRDDNNNLLPELTSEYQDFVIDITKSYNEEYYTGLNPLNQDRILVNSKPINFIGLIVDTSITQYDLDIDYIYTCKDIDLEHTKNIWNDFLGDTSYKETANIQTTDISTIGKIQDRKIRMEQNSSFEIIHRDSNEKIISYIGKYLCISGSGDFENLKVYVATRDNDYGDRLDYNTYIKLDGNLSKVKLEYIGEDYVSIDELYLTNYSSEDILTEVPRILYGGSSEEYVSLDKFNAEQTIFYSTPDRASEYQKDIFRHTNSEYRYSTSKSKETKNISITNSVLRFKATKNVNNTELYNFSAKYKTSSKNYKYFVMKIKLGGLAKPEYLSLCFDETKIESISNYKKYSSLYCGYGLNSPINNENNPYKFENEYYYFIVDMDISGIPKMESIFVSINYTGQGEILIDEIFLSNTYDTILVNDKKFNETITIKSDERTKELELYSSNFNVLDFNVRLDNSMLVYEDSNPISNKFNSVIFKFDEKEFTTKELYTLTGLTLDEIFTKDINIKLLRNVKIDLEKSGIENCKTLFIISNSDGNFTIRDISLKKIEKYLDYKFIDEENKFFIKSQQINGENIINKVQNSIELNYTEDKANKGFKILGMDIILTNSEDNLNGLCFDFDGKKFYFNGEKLITLLNNVYLRDKTLNLLEKNTLYFDLSLIGITSCEKLTIYGDSQIKSIKITNFCLGKYESLYNKVIKVATQDKLNEIPADINEPYISIDMSGNSITKATRVEIPLRYYDKETLNINDLSIAITVTKITDDKNNRVNEEVDYVLENVKITTSEEGYQIYTCNLSFDTSVGNYEIVVELIDKADNSITKRESMKVTSSEQKQAKTPFNWKLLLIILGSVLALGLMILGIILLINYIRNKDNKIRF